MSFVKCVPCWEPWRAQRNTYLFLRRSPVFLVSFTKRFPAGRQWPSPLISTLHLAEAGKSQCSTAAKFYRASSRTAKDTQRNAVSKQTNKQTENKPKKKTTKNQSNNSKPPKKHFLWVRNSLLCILWINFTWDCWYFSLNSKCFH